MKNQWPIRWPIPDWLRERKCSILEEICIDTFAPNAGVIAFPNEFPDVTIQECLDAFGSKKANSGYSFGG